MKRNAAELLGGNMSRTKAMFEFFDAAKFLAAASLRESKRRGKCVICGFSMPCEPDCRMSKYVRAYEAAEQAAKKG